MENSIDTCCFTGHRPGAFSFGYDEGHPACMKIKQALARQIFFLVENGVTCFLSGMAQGVDMWAAELVLDIRDSYPKLRLGCILPCETQADRWHEGCRQRYFHILSQADYTHTISPRHTANCMKQRNYYLVDHARFVLAVFNGSPRSGTAQTLHYALRQKRPICCISPEDGSCTPFVL